jgi:hypothetical protein
MYHIYIYINIPLSLFHLITTTYLLLLPTYYYLLYYTISPPPKKKKKKKIFFVKSWNKLLKYYQISSLSSIFLRVFLLLLSNTYLVLPITITATTTSTSISWTRNSLMTLRWIIPWKLNLIVNLLNKLYLNLSF